MVLFVGPWESQWYTLGLLHSEGCFASFFAMLSGRDLQLFSKRNSVWEPVWKVSKDMQLKPSLSEWNDCVLSNANLPLA